MPYNQDYIQDQPLRGGGQNADSERILGYDTGGATARDFIRGFQNEEYYKGTTIYEPYKGFDYKEMYENLKREHMSFNQEKLREAGLVACRSLGGNNSYYGPMVDYRDFDDLLPELKKYGIKRIIDLANVYHLEDECKNIGLEYYYFDLKRLENAMKSKAKVIAENEIDCLRYGITDKNRIKKEEDLAIDLWKRNSRIDIDKLVNFIQTMQKGDLFIGCRMGTDRTDMTLFFDYLFNPKANHERIPIPNRNCDYLDDIHILYTKLTDADKSKMGWTEDFDKQFLKKLKDLKKMFAHLK